MGESWKEGVMKAGVMDDTTRIMTIELKVPAGNSFENLTLLHVYAPKSHGSR
jgi:hypothetical protein